jgi:hypothetical protein
MPRLIEVQDARTCASPLRVRAGDVLMIHAAGGRIESGADVVEVLGPFVGSVVGGDGSVAEPSGPPNSVLFRIRRAGDAVIRVIGGDPFSAPQASEIHIAAEP